MNLRIICVVVGCLSFALSLAAQTASSASSSAQVPPLIQFSNAATDEGGNTLSGVVSITFSFYAAQRGSEPLWTEIQNNVQLDPTGHYSVQLGITKPNGVPTALFTSGEARWLGVRIGEQEEQPRMLLLSVPYALKAGDAATIGGLPPSAFVLAALPSGLAASTPLDATVTPQTSAPQVPGGPVTGTGTVNYVPLWDSTSDITSSVIFQSGSGSTAKIGINTTAPLATLHVKGTTIIAGLLSLPATVTATAAQGAISQPQNIAASAYNSSTKKAVNQTFQWEAEPVGNDTASPSATLNLRFGSGTTPTETGFNIASNGVLTFAPLQTFNSNSGYSLDGALFAYGAANLESVAVGFGAGGVGSFGNTASGYGALFHNTSGSDNTANGDDALSSNNTGSFNTASGTGALVSNTTGNNNTADGMDALFENDIGSDNTAIGDSALMFGSGSGNTATGSNALLFNSGSYNTAYGYAASEGPADITGSGNTLIGANTTMSTGSLNNATAIGANAEVSENNAMVLGSIAGVNGATANVNVGIGTTTPDNTLSVNGTADKPGGGSWGTFSDRRLKTLNGSFTAGLTQILKLKPVRYRYKDNNALGIRDREEHVGFVAQDVQMVIPEAVTENGKGYLLLDNDPILWSMLNAIKEQQRQIRALKSELRATRQTLQKVQAQISAAQPALVAAK